METFPRRFGPYVLLRPLARGGMGALYLAIHGEKGMEKLCVVKTALPHLVGRGYGQRFRDEASVVVRLSHGNLVTVFDAGKVAGEIFIAMDFVEGKDLRAIWNRCAQKGVAFPIDIAVHIAKEMARGLTYVHAYKGLRLVHRDISPPNVLLSYTGEVKITDFGLAWSTLKLEKTAPGIIFGKVSYMAPEQARGEALDGRADIYSTGIILWELLTGRQLFPAAREGGPDDEVLERVRKPQAVAPSARASRVPPELDAIVLKALHADPAQRYQTGEEFRAALAAFQARTSPATDVDHVARFLKQLFGDMMSQERHERDELLHEAAALLSVPTATFAEPLVSKASKAAPPLPAGSDPRPDSTSELDLPAAVSGSDAPSRLIGTLLAGRYRIKRLCGEGGMGRVYEAEHVEIGRRVAVKVLHPAYTRTADVVERFRREARAASKVGHPNIVDVTDSGTTDDGSFFFVMEFVEGVELGLVIFKEGPLAVRRTLHIAAQMCDALEAAHTAGIIHRDLKPENVLLIRREGLPDFVKVLDFGIAKSTEVEETSKDGRRLTRPGVAMGTPEYMAPEQAAGKPADPRSDIYAVGSIIYEMLTGSPPYDGDNVMEVLHKKANEAPVSLATLRPDAPPSVIELVERAMARAPKNRPQSMGGLAQALRALEDAASDVPPTMSEVRQVTPHESPTFTGAVAIGPLVAALGVSRRSMAVAAGALVLVAGLVVVRATTRGPGENGAPAGPEPLPANVVAVATEPRPELEVRTRADGTPLYGPLFYGPFPAPGTELDDDQAAAPERAPPTSPRRRGRVARKGPSPAERSQLLREGWAHYRAQQFDKAKEAFTRVLASPRPSGRAYLGMAKVAFQDGNYPEVAKLARRGVKAGAGVEAQILLGDAYYKMNDYDRAHAAYTRALELEPNNKAVQEQVRSLLRYVERKLP